MRIVYFAVHDTDYPRNNLIRSEFVRQGHEVVVIERNLREGIARGSVHLLHRAVREAGWRRADVVILSELALQYALHARLLALMLRARLVVDAFVGMHETNVGDWGEVPVTSVRARLYAAFDKIAVRVADLTLTDTEVRARRWKEHGARDVSVVPVGAPDWASPTRAPETGPLQVLYYGNYIPLHGLDYVASAMTFLTDRTIEWTFIGNGSERPLIESQLRRAADGMPTRFLDHVSTYELARHIKESHVVLGVFGLSEKAGSVIANKVWQGLAGGRVVITRSSDALRELTFVSVDQLIQVDPECATDLAAQLDRLSRAHSTGELDTFTETSEWLETYVNSRASAVVQSLAERMLERGEGRTLR